MIDIMLRQYLSQGDRPRGNHEAYQLGRMISWRTKYYDQLPMLDKHLVYGLVVIRAIEDDLDTFQAAMESLFVARVDDSMTEAEFAERLINLSLAAHYLAIAEGGDIVVNHLDLLQESITSGGGVDILGLTDVLPNVLDIGELVDGFAASIDDMIVNPANELSTILHLLSAGERTRRIVMWITSALGSYTLGQLYLPDDVLLRWDASTLKQNCRLCLLLDGQIHYVVDWRNWFKSTNLKPQSHDLDCGGWECGCIYTKTTDGPTGLLPLG